MLFATAGVMRNHSEQELDYHHKHGPNIELAGPLSRLRSLSLPLSARCVRFCALLTTETMDRLIRLRLQQVIRRRDRRTDPLWAEEEPSPKLKVCSQALVWEEQKRFCARRTEGARCCHGNRTRSPTARSQRTTVPILKEPLTSEAGEDSAQSSIG